MKYIRIILCSVLSTALCLFVFTRAVHAGTAANIDFKKTSEFMREMETRPDFPVGMVLAHDYVYSIPAMGEKITPERRKIIIDFMKSLQQQDGGFTADKVSKDSSMLYTNHAVEILSYLNAGNGVDLNRIRSYVASLKNADGGYGFSLKAKNSTLANTYYAVHILDELNALSEVDRAKTVAFVKGFARKDGGFGYVKNQAFSNAQNTYFALSTLKALGMLDNDTKNNALRFLKGTPYVTGAYNLKDGGPQLVEEQVYALKALKILNAADLVKKDKVTAMLKKFYISFNGGFGPILGFGSTPDSTTNGLRLLVEIGKLKEPARFPLVKK